MSKPAISLQVEIKIEIPTNAYFMSGIRDFTLSMIRNMTDFSEQWAYRFQSVVDELCNNAIEHGSSKEDNIKVTFVAYPDQAIEIIVEDNGTGPDQKTAKEIEETFQANKNKDMSELGIRGRGLAFIVSEWTDSITVTDKEGGGVKVTVRKNLNDSKFQAELPSDDPTHIVLDA